MKYLFIDSNQYRHLFSRSEGFSDEVLQLLLNLIDRKHIKLVLPQQTKEEVERNRFRAWPENAVKTIENRIQKLKDLINKLQKDFSVYKNHDKLKAELEKEIKKLEKEKGDISKTFTENRSKANQKLKQLFNRAELVQEVREIQENARIRNQKGNPPYDNGGIGDCLIWESLLNFLPRKSQLIFVAHDNKAWGDAIFDKWLEKEFKDKIKGTITFSNKLADIPGLTAEEQEKIKTEELFNLKQNAVIDFVNSPSFDGAGERARRLLRYKHLLTTDDYKEILKAGITNHEIYQSFFTSGPLQVLVTGEDEYVQRELESIDENLWRQFREKYSINLKRQSDKQEPKVEETNINDIPF